MQNFSFLKTLFFVISIITFVSCDKDYNEIGTDIVGGDNDHYNFKTYSDATVKAYNQKLGVVASNNLPINPLGRFIHENFGTVDANFVTQLELSSTSPTFNNTDPDLYEDLPILDSVVMSIPYFSTLKETDDDGNNIYELDSIYGANDTKFRLHIYESGYYLRNLDPAQQFTQNQVFYNDFENQIDAFKIGSALNNRTDRPYQNEQFYFNKRYTKEVIEATATTEEEITKTAPSMRINLDTAFFYNKIMNASASNLASQDAFNNYFRGLYFKTTTTGVGNMNMMDFSKGKITLYYREDKITKDNPSTTANEYKLERISKTYVLNLKGNTISLLTNSSENADYLNTTNSTAEASKLYLKGGQGSMAMIDLFGSTDVKSVIKNSDGKFVLVDGANNISDEIDQIKVNGWLINEANLTFYVDESKMGTDIKNQPLRIMLYDLNNERPVFDYYTDATSTPSDLKKSKFIHGGVIEKVKVNNVDKLRYKIRITDHVKNLVKKDSTNIRLGLVMTENIMDADFSKLQNPIGTIKKVPQMAVLNPLGTILYGSLPVSGHETEKLKLEIYYTEPKN